MRIAICVGLFFGILITVTASAHGQSRVIVTYAGPPLPVDGAAATTQAIDSPASVVADGAGGFYVSSPVQNRVYHVASDGTLALFAGTGIYGFSGDGGPAVEAQLARPTGLALDAGGSLYIADSYSHRIRKITADGLISTVAGNGTAGFGGDNEPAISARLAYPAAVTVDSAGNLYVADLSNQRVRRVNGDGVITTVAGNGVDGFGGDDGPATSAQLANPESVSVDSAGNLYIADLSNQRIRRVSADGVITTVAGNGEAGFSGDDGPATSAQLANPAAVAVDSSGNLYIADFSNNRIRKVSTDGTISTLVGSGIPGFRGDGGPAKSAQLASPASVALDAQGIVYIADSANHRVRKVNGDGVISTVAGTAISGFSAGAGPANSAQLRNPASVAVDTQGNLYVADSLNQRIRKVTAEGTISTVAGPGLPGFLGDGGLASSAQLTTPQGVAADATGNLYIADTGNNRIRKVTADGTIRTVAGNGTRGFSGDGAPATSAQLSAPRAVAADSAGNLFVADTENHRIRRVTPDGVIRTVAGTGAPGSGGDGGAAISAQLKGPRGIAVDAAGNLYIADTDNHRIRIVSPSGVIRTVAGDGTPGFRRDGGPALSAQLSSPAGVALDTEGSLYIADSGNSRIRKVAVDGTITTVAGNGTAGFSGDGGPPLLAQVSNPAAVSVDFAGNIYIADSGNQRVRKVNSDLAYFADFGASPGVSSTLILVNPSTQVARGTVTLFDSAGELLPVKINGSIQSRLDFTIPTKGVSFYTTEAIGDPVAGSMQVNSTIPVGGTLVFAGDLGVAGVKAGQPHLDFFVPVESNTDTGVRTGVALSNPRSSSVSVTLNLRDSGGALVANGSVTVSLAGYGQLARFIEEIFQDSGIDFSQFRGTLEVNSPAPVNGLALRVSPAELATLPVTPANPESNTLYFAQFGNGQGVSSTLMLINPSATTKATGTVQLFAGDGMPLSVNINGTIQNGAFSFETPPQGIAFYQTDGQGSLAVGSVKVVSDIPIGGTILFAGDIGVAGVGAVRPSSDFVIPIESDSSAGVQTGVALSNPSGSSVGVTFLLRDTSGALVPKGSVAVSIAGNGQLSRFAEQIFQDRGINFSQFHGTLEVVAAAPVNGMAILVSPGKLATLPITEVK